LGLAIVYDGGKLHDLDENNMEKKLGDPSNYAELESGGTFLGFVGIKDPVRSEVKGAIEDCKTAGIRVIMITGDSKETAVSIAKELEILDSTQEADQYSWTGNDF
jgi:P-type E1-E2 ATPase